jgi:hypothetical protein
MIKFRNENPPIVLLECRVLNLNGFMCALPVQNPQLANAIVVLLHKLQALLLSRPSDMERLGSGTEGSSHVIVARRYGIL